MVNGVFVEGKGIWVICNGNFFVENIEFIGVCVFDCNGVGICFENGMFIVCNLIFKYNENGILMVNNVM